MPAEYDPDRTLGPAVAATATLAGFPPDPEQRMLLDLAFALDKRGKSLAFEVVVIAPRQNLKTGFLKQYALGQLFVRDEPLVPWSAHEFATASEAVNDVESLIDGSDVLRRRIKLTTRGGVARRGAVPEIRTVTGARLIFKTRTAGGGRGLSGRKTILDEAYALQPGQVGALLPIMLAQPDPQVVAASSACRPESAVLWDMVQRGRAGGERRMVFAEWCAAPPERVCALGEQCTHARDAKGCGCDNPDVLLGVHSAITRGRILVQTLLDLRSSMPPAEYGREVMGWHDEVVEDGFGIDLSGWPGLCDPAASMSKVGAFAVAVEKDRKFAAIGAAGPSTADADWLHLELTSRDGVLDYREGVDWVVPRCVELDKAFPGVGFAVDDHGPAASLIVALREAGLEVVGLTTDDLATATEQFVDGVRAGLFTHGPQDAIDDAIAGVRARMISDGRMALGRKKSAVDISALEVLPLAAWAAARSVYARVLFASDVQPKPDDGPPERHQIRVLTQEETTTIRVPPRR